MNSYHRPDVDLARPLAPQRFRSARDVFAEELVVKEVLAEESLIEEVLVRDVRAELTPSDMVEGKLKYALNGAPLGVTQMRTAAWQSLLRR